ncbi:MAG: serine/threonine-protein kinase PknK, partial [Anaerolineae bacterium]|nr:serine/threonine-protein kinase PknK [Anaerolineae bacterium]
MDQLASALSIAHQSSVIHQDLKPANILLDTERNAYLSDFGIAKDMAASYTADLGAVTGTPAYIAPEQIQSGGVTARTDIYSLGLMMFEVVTGRRAFEGNKASDLIIQQLTEMIPAASSLRPDLPVAIDDVLLVATAKDPDSRFQDVVAFANAFREALSGERFSQTFKRPTNLEDDDLFIITEDVAPFRITTDMLDLEAPALELVNPYKGLRAFQESDSDDFYGRDALISTLLERMANDQSNYRFLAVVGPSGSGKSSVVKAGVIPALRRGALPNSKKFFITEMVPSIDAMNELENAILSVAAYPPDDLKNRLRNSTEGLFNIVNEVLPDDGESEFFILIDQFEEVFTQTEVNTIRVHFIESLRYALTHPDSRMRAVITIRADFYDRPLQYSGFGQLMRERTEIVLPLTDEELETTIVKPAQKAGARVQESLISRIVTDVSNEPGALPLLQYTLTELFERRQGLLMTLENYEETGGVLGSLARRAEETFKEMSPKQQEAARQLFLRLVTLGEGTEDTRRRVSYSELAFEDAAENDPLQVVLDRYVQYRLLTSDVDPQTREPTYEVATKPSSVTGTACAIGCKPAARTSAASA